MAPTAAECDDNREWLSSPPSASYPLLIVEAHRRHIGEHHSLQIPYIDSYFHRRRDAEDIDFINHRHKSPLAAAHVNHDVSEQTLPFRLIVGLSRQLFAVKAYRIPSLNCFSRVVISPVKLCTCCV